MASWVIYSTSTVAGAASRGSNCGLGRTWSPLCPARTHKGREKWPQARGGTWWWAQPCQPGSTQSPLEWVMGHWGLLAALPSHSLPCPSSHCWIPESSSATRGRLSCQNCGVLIHVLGGFLGRPAHASVVALCPWRRVSRCLCPCSPHSSSCHTPGADAAWPGRSELLADIPLSDPDHFFDPVNPSPVLKSGTGGFEAEGRQNC